MSVYIKNVILLAFLFYILATLSGCSDEKGPTVPASTKLPTQVSIQRNQEIRVGMLSFSPAPKIFFSITRGVFDMKFGVDIAAAHSGFPGQVWHVEVREEKFLRLVDQDGRFYDVPQEYIAVQPADEAAEGGHIAIGDDKQNVRPYRGKFEITIENKRLIAINVVKMEEYLLGVVPAEMPPTWPSEALKAQAVAARSYAYFNIGRFAYRKFDLADTVVSQAYGGVYGETEATTNAVVDTEGEVVTYSGNLANTLYHSTCGGGTASAADLFAKSPGEKVVIWSKEKGNVGIVAEVHNPEGDIPYLIVTDDMSPWDFDYCKDSPYYRWHRSYTMEQLREALANSIHTDPGNRLSSIDIASADPSGWVRYIFISGERDQTARGSEFRGALNKYLENNALPSQNFEMKYRSGGYDFSGKGFGHGIGMCQWGAKGRAEDGVGYVNIIIHYYPGCEITEIPYAGGLNFFRDEDFFFMGERQRKSDEVIGLGKDYIPPEQLEPEGESVSGGDISDEGAGE